MGCVDDLDDALADADIVVLLQNHASYDLGRVTSTARCLLDTRGVTHGPEVLRL